MTMYSVYLSSVGVAQKLATTPKVTQISWSLHGAFLGNQHELERAKAGHEITLSFIVYIE